MDKKTPHKQHIRDDLSYRIVSVGKVRHSEGEIAGSAALRYTGLIIHSTLERLGKCCEEENTSFSYWTLAESWILFYLFFIFLLVICTVSSTDSSGGKKRKQKDWSGCANPGQRTCTVTHTESFFRCVSFLAGTSMKMTPRGPPYRHRPVLDFSNICSCRTNKGGWVKDNRWAERLINYDSLHCINRESASKVFYEVRASWDGSHTGWFPARQHTGCSMLAACWKASPCSSNHFRFVLYPPPTLSSVHLFVVLLPLRSLTHSSIISLPLRVSEREERRETRS